MAIEALLGLVLLPISCGYLLVGRFLFAKLFFANVSCDGCGLCARACPVGALSMRGEPSRPYWRYSCESCMRCMGFCPKRAVEVNQPWGVLVWALSTIPLAALGLHLLGGQYAWAAALEGGLVERALQFLWVYPAIFGSYLLLWWMARLRPLNWLLTWTSLFHLCRRYREPSTRLKKLR